MQAREDELEKTKERQQQAEEQLREFEAKQQQVWSVPSSNSISMAWLKPQCKVMTGTLRTIMSWCLSMSYWCGFPDRRVMD